MPDFGGLAGDSEHGTLVADTVTTVTLDDDYPAVEVYVGSGDGAGDAFVLVDPGGTDPTVGGAGTIRVPRGSWAILRSPGRGGSVVKLISEGTPEFSVQGLRP